MLKIAVGHSEEVDAVDAIDDVLEQCREQLDGVLPNAGILYSAIEFEHDVLVRRIVEAYPEIELIGCTTDGEVSSVIGYAEDSVTLVLFCSDEIEIKAGYSDDLAADPEGATRRAVEQARAKLTSEPKLCMTFPEGLGISTQAVLTGLRGVLGDRFPICGGMAGDQLQFKNTFQFYKDRVLRDSVPVLLFAGPLLFSHGVASGWKPIGRRHTVTSAEGNTIFAIDEEPAGDLYKYYLNEHSPHYPLAVYTKASDRFYLSTPGQFNPEDGSIICQNSVPVGAEVQIAEASRDEIIEGAQHSIRYALEHYPGHHPSVGLVFSCALRRASLGTRTAEEYGGLPNVAADLVMCGFYTYGEICPLGPGSPTQSHNCTFVTVLLGSE